MAGTKQELEAAAEWLFQKLSTQDAIGFFAFSGHGELNPEECKSHSCESVGFRDGLSEIKAMLLCEKGMNKGIDWVCHR
jgi:hypothetical protein